MKPLKGLLLLLALLLASARGHANNVVWTNPAGGNWSNLTNWAGGVLPGATDDVFIVTNGTYTVKVDVATTVASLTVGGLAGVQTLSVTNTLTLGTTANFGTNTVLRFSGGSISGNGVVTLNGALMWNNAVGLSGGFDGSGVVNAYGPVTISPVSGTAAVLSGWTLNLAGQTTWSGPGAIWFENGAVMNNLTGGVFTVACDSSATTPAGPGGTFNNAGIFSKTAGTGTTTWAEPFNNSGTVLARSGTIRFTAALSNAATSNCKFIIGGPTAGNNYGRLAVVGVFPMAGTFNVSLTNSYTPTAGDTFQIISWGSRQGGFSQASGLDLGNGLHFSGIASRSGLSLAARTSVVPTPPPPTNLVNQVVAWGDTAVFSFSPPGVPPFSYQWMFNGTNLIGETNGMLAVSNVQSNNVGGYCVTVVDALNRNNTYCASLSALTVPGFISQPSGATLINGSNFVLTVGGSGSGPLHYQWQLNGESIPGATNSTFLITNAQMADAGLYSVLAANQVRAVASSNATVRVGTNGLPFADDFANAGSIYSFSGAGTGSNTSATRELDEPHHDGKPGYHSVWLHWFAPAAGVATFDTSGSGFDTLLAAYSGSALTNLVSVADDDDSVDFFTSRVAFNATAYTAYYIAVDGLNNACGDIVLSWNLDTSAGVIPTIATQPQDTTAAPGGTATFNVVAASTTNVAYRWYMNDWLAVSGATNSTLLLSNVTAANAGNYRVELIGSDGQVVESLAAVLELGSSGISFDKLEDLLNNLHGAQWQGRPRPLDGGLGGFPSVSVGTIGSQLINNFNSTTEQGEPVHAVVGGSSRWYLLTAATNATLVIDTMGSDIATVLSVYTGSDIFSLRTVATDVHSAPDGVHSLVRISALAGTNYLVSVDGVSGAQGNITLNWRMGIAPGASGAVQNLALVAGTELSLSAGAGDNVTSPHYQWQRNGVDIGGETNATLAISSIQFNQCGSYSVLVSNLVGSVVNSIATVSVQSPLVGAASSSGFQVSGSATQTVLLQLSTNLTQWGAVCTNPTTLLPVIYLDTNAFTRPDGFYRLAPWP